jgi:hypothetical protein
MRNQEYFTKDLYEASYLYACGFRLLRLDNEQDYFLFVFEDSKGTADTMIREYWNFEGFVCPKKFAEAITTLKTVVFARRRIC